jgi:hypothetical protein
MHHKSVKRKPFKAFASVPGANWLVIGRPIYAAENPRAAKRRPKYDLLNRPRAQYRDRPRRSVRRSRANMLRLI